MSSEKCQTQKIIHCIIPLIWNYKTGKTSLWQQKEGWCVSGCRRGTLTVKEHEGTFWEYGGKSIFWMTVVKCAYNFVNIHWTVHLALSAFSYMKVILHFFNHKKIRSIFSQLNFSEGELTLLSATMKGHFLDFKRLIDSIVWGSKPCIISTTKMAISQRELPLFLRLLLEKKKMYK